MHTPYTMARMCLFLCMPMTISYVSDCVVLVCVSLQTTWCARHSTKVQRELLQARQSKGSYLWLQRGWRATPYIGRCCCERAPRCCLCCPQTNWPGCLGRHRRPLDPGVSATRAMVLLNQELLLPFSLWCTTCRRVALACGDQVSYLTKLSGVAPSSNESKSNGHNRP